MGLTAFIAMVRKDLLLFFSDRRSVIVTFAVPIVIGAFIGSLTSGMSGSSSEPLRIKVAVVDLDHSDISSRVVRGASADKNLIVTVMPAAEARSLVQKGAASAAVIIPEHFGDDAGRAFFGGSTAKKPELAMLSDPSRAIELGMIRGILTQHVMEAVSTAMFSGQSGARFVDETLAKIDTTAMPADQKRLLKDMLSGVQRYYRDAPASSDAGGAGVFSMPYSVREEPVTAGNAVPYNGYAHSFAGMGIQFLLFAMLNLGVELLLERQQGLWKRLRSAPLSRYLLLAAKGTSGTIISLMTLLVSFGFAMIFFKVRISGSVPGFLLVAISCSVMAATFGLLIAAIGRTPATTRGISSLVVLVMVMVGGAWIPTFLFPKWMQQLTFVVPVRWAVDGLDATTWRGLPFTSAVAPSLALLGFAVLFGVVTLARFRWEEA